MWGCCLCITIKETWHENFFVAFNTKNLKKENDLLDGALLKVCTLLLNAEFREKFQLALELLIAN